MQKFTVLALASMIISAALVVALPAAYATHLSAPVITSSNVSGNTFTATWTASPFVAGGQDKYQIEIDDNSAFSSPSSPPAVNAPTTTFSGTFADGTYYFRVKAQDQNTETPTEHSDWSQTISFVINTVPQPPADSTPPAITPTVSGALGNNGWYISNVQVSWSVSDAESALTSTNGCETTTINYDTNGADLTCTATSQGGTSSQTVTVKRDATAPVISATVTPSPNANGWNNVDVIVVFTAVDTLSGISGSNSQTQTISSEGQNLSTSATFTDNAGNSATKTASGINIDKTAPTIGVTQNLIYITGQAATSDAACTDALSGIEVCSISSIVTSSVGAHSYVVSATDKAGNSATVTVNYSVKYDFRGFLSPADKSTNKQGSAIPVKFQLFDASGNPVSTATATITVDGNAATSTGSSSTGNYFRYDPTSQQYIFNLNTKPLSVGTHLIVVKLDDGTSRSLSISLK